MQQLAETIHVIVWGPWTMMIFLATGIWLTVKSGGFQFLGFSQWWRETIGSIWEEEPSQGDKEEEGRTDSGITPFQAACTGLAATIGTGNIVGVATALTAGGPGALFWMWVSAFMGMMTAYAETALGQKYRYRKQDGHWMCGPMVYMERGVGSRCMGIFYACLALLSSLGMGSMVQSNSMSTTLNFSAGIRPGTSAVVITALTALVILGGIGRISRVTEKLMPVSAGIYVAFSVMVLFFCRESIWPVLQMVFSEAFTAEAAGGGVGGFLLSRSVRYGMSRGVFSNEAGLGSMAVLHGAAENTTPEKQGMWAMFEVFFDTIVICSLTGLVILCVCHRVGRVPAALDGARLTAWCFSRCLGALGERLVSGAMTVFAFATIIAWYYLGRQTASYLGTRIFGREIWMGWYPVLYLAAVFAGCICRLDVVWMVSDVWNGLMAWPNLAALWILSRQIPFCQRKIHIDKNVKRKYHTT